MNVAQCLAALPDKLASTGGTTPGTTGPVSKRRASFPAAPLRRISLKPPPLAGTGRVTALLEPGVIANNDPVSSITIAEEREEVDSVDHPLVSSINKNEPAHQQDAPIPPLSAAAALVHLPSATSPPPILPNGSTTRIPVTIRRRG